MTKAEGGVESPGKAPRTPETTVSEMEILQTADPEQLELARKHLRERDRDPELAWMVLAIARGVPTSTIAGFRELPPADLKVVRELGGAARANAGKLLPRVRLRSDPVYSLEWSGDPKSDPDCKLQRKDLTPAADVLKRLDVLSMPQRVNGEARTTVDAIRVRSEAADDERARVLAEEIAEDGTPETQRPRGRPKQNTDPASWWSTFREKRWHSYDPETGRMIRHPSGGQQFIPVFPWILPLAKCVSPKAFELAVMSCNWPDRSAPVAFPVIYARVEHRLGWAKSTFRNARRELEAIGFWKRLDDAQLAYVFDERGLDRPRGGRAWRMTQPDEWTPTPEQGEAYTRRARPYGWNEQRRTT